MRQVVSLSLPAAEVKQVKDLAKQRGFPSVSSYIQYLFRADKDTMSEAELLKTVATARREYHRGGSIKARSIVDLL